MTAAGLSRRTTALVRAGAAAAIIAGALRIVSTFIPYEPNSPGLEALYGVIDLGLMFGLIAVYIAGAEALGIAGLAFFLIALAGVASIVGPDAQAFGIDFYRIGALVFVAALAGLSAQLLRAGLMRTSAALWLATFAASFATVVFPQAFLAAGLALGAGYVTAGVGLLRRRPVAPAPAVAA
jgi:hypothetical protein